MLIKPWKREKAIETALGQEPLKSVLGRLVEEKKSECGEKTQMKAETADAVGIDEDFENECASESVERRSLSSEKLGNEKERDRTPCALNGGRISQKEIEERQK